MRDIITTERPLSLAGRIPRLIPALRLGDVYIHQWTGSSLVQVMVCVTCSTKSLLEPVMPTANWTLSRNRLNILRPRQNGYDLQTTFSKHIFLNDNLWSIRWQANIWINDGLVYWYIYAVAWPRWGWVKLEPKCKGFHSSRPRWIWCQMASLGHNEFRN